MPTEDKFRPFEIRPANAAETTYIPTEGLEAHLGAMAYLAVLAYPKRAEWGKRDEFIEAGKALLFKLWIKKGQSAAERKRRRMTIHAEYREFRPRDIAGILNKAGRRIVNRRLPAAAAAGWFAMDGITIPNFPVPIGNGRSTPALFQISAPSHLRPASRAISRLLRKRDGSSRPGWEGSGWDPAHVWDRILRDSEPVLHLAMALPDEPKESRECKERIFDLVRLILEPKWVQGSLRTAETLRCGWLPRVYPNYKPEDAISLIPSTLPPTK